MLIEHAKYEDAGIASKDLDGDNIFRFSEFLGFTSEGGGTSMRHSLLAHLNTWTGIGACSIAACLSKVDSQSVSFVVRPFPDVALSIANL
ncbi:MAG TPA: hypothetical protein VK642_12335 [Burkholderiales bacterium]|nr:hypothetical protein [Burkholderiales bacterium]